MRLQINNFQEVILKQAFLQLKLLHLQLDFRLKLHHIFPIRKLTLFIQLARSQTRFHENFSRASWEILKY